MALRTGSFRLPAGDSHRDRYKPPGRSSRQSDALVASVETALAATGTIHEEPEPEAHGVNDLLGPNEHAVDEAEIAARKTAKNRKETRMSGQARQIYCHLCGKPTGLKTFRTAHLKVCRRMWREDENSTVKALIAKGMLPHSAKGRPFPPEPMLPQV